MKNINGVLSASRGLRQGFTLAEVVIVIVILGVLAGMAIPTYNNIIDQYGEKEAYVNLQTIYRAEKLFHAKNGQYWSSAAPSGEAPLNLVTSNLNMDLRQPKYYPVFMITPRMTGSIQTGFKAIAAKSLLSVANYTTWADQFGQSTELGEPFLAGDFNQDGKVDGADYTVWADNYGRGMASIDETGFYTPPSN